VKTEIIQGRLVTLADLELKSGSHNDFDRGVCAMEAVAWLAGEKHSDRPTCACPVIASFMRRWNDRLPNDDDRNRYLRPLLPLLVSTRSTRAAERRRAWMATDWTVRTQIPAALRLAGLAELAAKLEALPEAATIVEIRPALAGVREAGEWGRTHRWSAWRAAFVAAFRVELEKTVTATYGAYAASAAAAASADYATSAAYAADAAHAAAAASATSADHEDFPASAAHAASAASADHAAYAVYTADAADAARAASADSAAYAAEATGVAYAYASPTWWKIRDAVHARLRAHHRPRITEIEETSNAGAVDLVGRMCAIGPRG
jgi:hypothetical protein